MRTPWTAFFAIGLVASPALGAEKTRDDGGTTPGVDVAASASLGTGADLELGAAWMTRWGVAFGVVGGMDKLVLSHSGDAMYVPGAPPYTDTFVWRLAPSVRWDFVRAEHVRIWVGGQVGLAFIRDSGVVMPGETAITTEVRHAPYVGGSIGLALRPVSFVSIGPELKWLHFAASAPDSRGTSDVQGPVDGGYVGLVLAFHVPLR